MPFKLFFGPWNFIFALCAEQSLHCSNSYAEQSLKIMSGCVYTLAVKRSKESAAPRLELMKNNQTSLNSIVGRGDRGGSQSGWFFFVPSTPALRNQQTGTFLKPWPFSSRFRKDSRQDPGIESEIRDRVPGLRVGTVIYWQTLTGITPRYLPNLLFERR